MCLYNRNLISPLLIVACLAASGCVPVVQTGSTSTSTNGAEFLNNGIYQDRIYNENIETVQFNYDGEPLFSSVIPIVQEQPLFVTFDELELNIQEEEYAAYNFQIIHCNADWRKSKLYNMDYLYEYNEYSITNETFSYNTKIPFIHYRFPIPRLKIPGNYAIKVYRGSNENDVVFTKRLMVYEPLVAISAEVTRSSDVSERDMRHQIDFTVDYGNINIVNPLNDVYVVIRQNQQWFNAIQGLKPTFVQEQDRRLEYRHFNLENNFYAGNEYRYFDIRTVNAFGQNVGDINKEKTPIEAFLLPDRSRANEAYSQYQDQDGAYFIGNAETRGGQLNSDYISTYFFLNTEELAEGDVYVIGAFNNRILAPANRMQYDSTLHGYTLDLLLKQGFYNYLYYVETDGNQNPYRFEGSHFQTENQYEILVYVRPLGARADLLVGYTSLYSGDRLR